MGLLGLVGVSRWRGGGVGGTGWVGGPVGVNLAVEALTRMRWEKEAEVGEFPGG